MGAARRRCYRKEAVSSQPPTDETTFDAETLPLDLVEDILCRLPVKLLMQLRCVCKSWNSLISDPIFAKKHLRLSRTLFNRRHLISHLHYREYQLCDSPLTSVFNSTSASIPRTRFTVPSNIQDGFYKVIGSCDGILCFSIGKYNHCVMVWNPSIRKFKILPALENQLELKSWMGKTMFGFGYDCLTDNYKVVALCCDGHFNLICNEVKVHTFGENTWKTFQGFPSPLPLGIPLTNCGIFVSGTLNWMRFSPDKSLVISSFDLGNGSYQELLPPDDVGVNVFSMMMGAGSFTKLGVLRDCLCILSNILIHTNIHTNIHVWLMEDYGNKGSWTKLFVVTYDELFIGPNCIPATSLYFGPDCFPTYSLYVLEDDQLLSNFAEKIVVYNSRNRTSKVFKVEPIFGDCRLDDHAYFESLISP